MTFRRSHASLIGAALLIFTSAAHAQETADAAPVEVPGLEQLQGIDLPELVETSIRYMQQQNWPMALAYNQAAVQGYGNNAMSLFGPRFGGIYFRKGVCELKLGKYDEAMKSFETCYKDFANKKDAEGDNPFEKTCLLQWAEAAMGKEEWQQALDLFQKFLNERDKQRDQFSKGSFYISLAVCYYNLGQIAEGNENLEIAINNRLSFKVPDSAILGAFRYLVDVGIKEDNEQAVLDFVTKNRGQLIVAPYAMVPYSGLFIKMATDAMKAGMESAALAIFQLVPSTDAAINDTRVKIAELGSVPRLRTMTGATLDKQQLEDQLKQLEDSKRGKQSLEMIKLAAMAYLYEQHGNTRGAYAAYRQLEQYYPNSGNRENNLYNLARISFLVGADGTDLTDARKFLKTYPNSENAPIIRRLMLSGLFAERKYDQCIERASVMIDELKKGTKEHDLCLHVLGGAYFYTGQYEKAEPLLAEHVELYPQSESAIAAAYFRASNPYRMQQLSKAGPLLDEFIAKYPDPKENSFLPFAYYDRATCYYYDEKNDEALAKVDTLIEKHGDSAVADQAQNLRGNILLSLERPIDAEGAYQAGLRIAERKGNKVAAGESIYNMVNLLIAESEGKEGEASRLKEALPLVDKFWAQYADGSPYAREMAIVQLPVLESAGRLDEGLKRLQTVITAMARDAEARGMESILPVYTDAYLKNHTAEELKDHYNQFPGVRVGDRAARALLRIQVISVYEDLGKKAEDEAVKRSANAMIKVLFRQLKNDFAVADLTSSILIQVGNYLRQKTSTPREALPFYDEVIKRNDQEHLFAALMGRADIYGESANKEDLAKGLADFLRVFESSQDKKEREFSLFRIVELLVAKEDFEQASKKARLYLDKEEGFAMSKHSPDVSLLLARSFEGRKMTEDAISMYAKVWATKIGVIRASSPAIKRWMELLWERNKPGPNEWTHGDRQGAYVAGASYIKNTRPISDQMSASDLELWREVEKLVRQYEANPDIKSLEQLEAEKTQ